MNSQQTNRFGIFMDGTDNDMDVPPLTNVGRLFKMYNHDKAYIKGIGAGRLIKLYYETKQEGFNEFSLAGIYNPNHYLLGQYFNQITGLGLKSRLDALDLLFFDPYKSKINLGDYEHIDIFGFSRGAASARIYSNNLLDRGLGTSFMGIFDTVSQFGIPKIPQEFSLGKQYPISNLGLGWAKRMRWYEEKVKINNRTRYVAHAVAGNENRRGFPLSSIFNFYKKGLFYPRDFKDLETENAIERVFWGSHSDVGGGYPEGGNPDALQWVILKGSSQGITFDPANLSTRDLKDAASVALHNSQCYLTERLFKDSFDKSKSNRDVWEGNLQHQSKSNPSVNLDYYQKIKIKSCKPFIPDDDHVFLSQIDKISDSTILEEQAKKVYIDHVEIEQQSLAHLNNSMLDFPLLEKHHHNELNQLQKENNSVQNSETV